MHVMPWLQCNPTRIHWVQSPHCVSEGMYYLQPVAQSMPVIEQQVMVNGTKSAYTTSYGSIAVCSSPSKKHPAVQHIYEHKNRATP